jgi:disulfide bond formation protein DsbB
MATGFCEDVELQILGLSLAQWALVAFSVSLAMAIGGLLSSRGDS